MVPTEVEVGIGLPHGNASTSQPVAELVLVHPKVTAFIVPKAVTKFVGFRHVGGGLHVTFAFHPALVTEPSVLNLNVKHPLGSVEEKGPGIVVPQYAPASPPGTFIAVFVLAI